MKYLKQIIKKKINKYYFNIKTKEETLVFTLNNAFPLSENFIIIKHHKTGKRISKKIKKSEVNFNINEILSIGELGIFDIYLQTNIYNKKFLNRSSFKNQHKNKIIYDENNEFFFKSVNKNSLLSFELRNNPNDDLIDITKVYGEDISEIIYTKPISQKNFEYKISAIVLVYNGGDYLRDCIYSLVNQTIKGLEIILINDKSTDDSLNVCKEFAMKYPNIRIIDKQENHGLATSANIGIKIAKGEYIILVDNDDIVPYDSYEKLYNKAKENDADISVGQANLLYGNRQNEMYEVERKVLEKEKVINNINEFPALFNDAFYWNKIIKKSLLIDNDIYLPKGMIYADRLFSHMAYIYANKISIIPDCIYIWRIQIEEKKNKSLSRRRNESWNYINRIESYKLELNKIQSIYPDYFKILMRRVITPIYGIQESNDFKEVFYNIGVKFLKRECGKLKNIYDNSFGIWDNIILFLLLNDYKKQIDQLLSIDIDNQRDLINIDYETYWKLPLFDEIIPHDFFKIKSMIHQFLNIMKITTTNDFIIFEGIKLPKYLKTKKCEINFVGKTNFDGILKENTLSYEINLENLDENIYSLKVLTSDLDDFEVYDIFFKAYYENRLSDNFRVKKECIETIEEKSNDIFIGITKYNNISIISQKLDKKFKIKANDNYLKFTLLDSDTFKQKVIIFLQNDLTHEKTYLQKINKNEYLIEWKYFIDNDSNYSFYISIFDKKVNNTSLKFNLKYLNDFNDIKLFDKKIFIDYENNLKLSTN